MPSGPPKSVHSCESTAPSPPAVEVEPLLPVVPALLPVPPPPSSPPSDFVPAVLEGVSSSSSPQAMAQPSAAKTTRPTGVQEAKRIEGSFLKELGAEASRRAPSAAQTGSVEVRRRAALRIERGERSGPTQRFAQLG